MFEALAYLPTLLLNQSYESYIQQHIFNPLEMSASTFSISQAEKATLGEGSTKTLAHGFYWSTQDLTIGRNGTLLPIVPYFKRPGEEEIFAGAGGVLSSARDMVGAP
jgi:CubicO group peptidase (beta-lactamase class C family)